MKNLILIAAYVLVALNIYAGTEPYKVSIGANDLVIASAVTGNNHVYVFTAPKSGDFDPGRYKTKGKVTLMHFDENNKLILKKVLLTPMVNGAKFMIDAAFEVGDQLIVTGTAEDKKGKCVSGYVTVDKTTLVASKKVIPMMENMFEISFSLTSGRNSFTYTQSEPGKALGIFLTYSTPKEKTSRYDSRTSQHGAYFIIDEKAILTEVLKFDHESENVDWTHESFLFGADGKMYILSASAPHWEYDWEAHELTKKSRTAMMTGEFKNVLEVFDPVNKSKSSYTVKFADSTLLISECQLLNTANGVFLVGSAGNGTFLYQRGLNGDTAHVTVSSYLFSQELIISGSVILITRNNFALIDHDLYDKMTKDSSLSKEDREIGNDEYVVLNSCYRLEDGTVLLSYVVYVYWNWPPYEEIKNDKNYSFEKNDEGRIVRSSGPGTIRKAEFKSIMTLSYKPGSATVTVTKQNIILNMQMEMMQYRPNISDMFYGTAKGNDCITYYVQPQGSSSQLLSSNSSTGSKIELTSSKSMVLSQSARYTIRQSVMIVSGEGQFTIVRLN